MPSEMPNTPRAAIMPSEKECLRVLTVTFDFVITVASSHAPIGYYFEPMRSSDLCYRRLTDELAVHGGGVRIRLLLSLVSLVYLVVFILLAFIS